MQARVVGHFVWNGFKIPEYRFRGFSYAPINDDGSYLVTPIIQSEVRKHPIALTSIRLLVNCTSKQAKQLTFNAPTIAAAKEGIENLYRKHGLVYITR